MRASNLFQAKKQSFGHNVTHTLLFLCLKGNNFIVLVSYFTIYSWLCLFYCCIYILLLLVRYKKNLDQEKKLMGFITFIYGHHKTLAMTRHLQRKGLLQDWELQHLLCSHFIKFGRKEVLTGIYLLVIYERNVRSSKQLEKSD